MSSLQHNYSDIIIWKSALPAGRDKMSQWTSKSLSLSLEQNLVVWSSYMGFSEINSSYSPLFNRFCLWYRQSIEKIPWI